MRVRSRVRSRIRSLKRFRHPYYPQFVFGLPLSKGETPVFTYHDADPESFAADLSFLRHNGYRTLSTAEFVSTRGRSGADLGVLLTFDDARRSFWEVAFPLLQKFKARATLFAPTHWMAGAQQAVAGDSLEECRRSLFMSWEQLRACSRSGLVDIQSHGHRHALVYTSNRLVDFASPGSFVTSDVYDWPMRWDGQKDIFGLPPLGTPIYEAAPLFSAHQRTIEDRAVTRQCQEFVATRGGADFFRHADWHDQLAAAHKAAQANRSHPAPMNPASFLSLLRSDFLLSNSFFQEEMGAYPRYLAFPWWLGSETSIEAAALSGIEAVFGVDMDFHRAHLPGRRTLVFSRTTQKWLRFLPGEGRLQLHRPRVLSNHFKHFFPRAFLAH